MKVLFELSVKCEKWQLSWLRNNSNSLFIIEDDKRLKTLSIEDEPGKELQSATLAESRSCTSLCWNKDGSLLALVVDKRQIYIWEVRVNNFTQFKPAQANSDSAYSRRAKTRSIELVRWSQLTNKLIICYSTGQLMICDYDSNLTYKFIDNSDGVLKKISLISVSDQLDLFACVTIISEVLVMTFDGETRLYLQGEELSIVRIKFSPLSTNQLPDDSSTSIKSSSFGDFLWLAYQTKSSRLFLKRIPVNEKTTNNTVNSEPSELDVISFDDSIDSEMIDFFWLNSSHLIGCFVSGQVLVFQLKLGLANDMQAIQFSFITENIINIEPESAHSPAANGSTKAPEFIAFGLELASSRQPTDSMNGDDCGRVYSLAAMTRHKLYYFQIFQSLEPNGRSSFALEKVDDLDLTESLQRIGLELNRIEWSYDCSMLAVQLINGHVLVYRTKLKDYMVSSYGPKTAYLSGANEITVLNYEPDVSQKLSAGHLRSASSPARPSTGSSGSSSASSSSASSAPANRDGALSGAASFDAFDNAITLNVKLKPTVIAIGPKHLAIGLNNVIRFYLIGGPQHRSGQVIESSFYEQDYISIVIAVCLCSQFVAVHFSDGRLKLHAITIANDSSEAEAGEGNSIDSNYNLTNERFFPDPDKQPVKITAFTLTDELFLHCTAELRLNVFSLKSWTILQVFDHSRLFDRPIVKVRQNARGNKFVCLTEEIGSVRGGELGAGVGQVANTATNAHLYDLYTNSVLKFYQNNLYATIFATQFAINALPAPDEKSNEAVANQLSGRLVTKRAGPKLNRITEAIWDADGRTVLLIERKWIHSLVVMDHTLEREGPVIEFVCTAAKASSYTALYASQGIVSFQTSLGKVVNSIWESHDDELKLTRLEQRIQALKMALGQADRPIKGSQPADEMLEPPLSLLEAQAKALTLKLEYLRTILPIYSLTRCREISEHLMSDEQFNFETRIEELDHIFWRQLAGWALFTMNLNFAQLIYRRHQLIGHVRTLGEIMDDARRGHLDTKTVVKTKLLVLLNCHN